jgi:hypothetical protein
MYKCKSKTTKCIMMKRIAGFDSEPQLETWRKVA